ncbi:MAG: DNA polymerase III subunit delta, partial [Alistipes sp.]|nr:DNA polymerase III subunit delta [Alistipes sp.]
MAKSTVKFKDSAADYERIAADIRARKFAPVYLLMGEESYFIDSLADMLDGSILDEAARAFIQITVYGRDSDAGQVVNLCRQMPMMG